jgi:hypothetical protein
MALSFVHDKSSPQLPLAYNALGHLQLSAQSAVVLKSRKGAAL